VIPVKSRWNLAKCSWLFLFSSSFFFLFFLGPKLVGEEQIWLGTWRQRREFAGFHRIPAICGIPANFPDFTGSLFMVHWNHC
jgi:hypothetical protein